MQLSIDIKEIITKMGFTPQNGKNNVYSKTYSLHNGYMICIDFNTEKIEYYTQNTPKEARISLGNGTTSNFSHTENFVVLECVDRLLEKGYTPSCIELEKTYPSGRGHSGRLDILVRTSEGVPYLMVECKTWGTKYEKEYKKMLKDGGQLFTYYTNDRATRYLCLYTSHLSRKIEYKSTIIDVNNSWRDLSGTKDIFGHWNKNFKDNGIFESYAAPYDIKHKALTYGMLRNLKEEDSGKIYNQIMEILRHNAVSDKPNAFNKLLNLFVCKIIDENKNEDDELQFQWLENDTDEILQMRLNDLYKEGMWRFLEIKVIDYEEKEVSDKLENIGNDDIKRWVMQMYQDTRLKKSPNFAFVEVQDEKTFQHNTKVVREIVELLQVYKFRYAQKHEFLGNFFELLLNTSMKQEAGQFFTPAPITRFIISSLPLRELVQKRVDDRNSEPLPTVIDYACGSGHFLTEYMSQMQDVIDTKINIAKASPSVRNQFQSWQGFTKFLWAKDTVYGIDFDNRLIKTAKVSAFFNGDGEAAIVWANGLDNFSKSEEYRGKLKITSTSNNKDNGQFDILISNPPYSVEAFKNTLQNGNETFDLYKYVTDNSSEIECLFIERMKQLLKIGGWAGVVLPISLLTNGGIHLKAREILLKHFKMKAIVELGSGTFMETGTNTIILFLERRSDNDYLSIIRAIDDFLVNKMDVTVAGIENAFSKYAENVYNNLSFEDYVSFISNSANENMQRHDLFVDYVKIYGNAVYEKAIEIEKEKLLYFLLTFEQEIVLEKTGVKQNEKRFLGYEFSKRRGHEGMNWLPGGTSLYDDNGNGNLLNPKKANSYIYRSFLGEKIDVDSSFHRNISYGRMSGFIEYGTNKFDKEINLGKVSTDFNSPLQQVFNYPLIQIRSFGTVQGGKRLAVGESFSTTKTEYPYIRVSDFKNKSINFDDLKYISKAQHEKIKRYTIGEADVYISIAGTIGLVGCVPNTLSGANLTENAAKIVIDPAEVDKIFLIHILSSDYVQDQIQKVIVGLGTPKLSLERIRQLKIPLPPMEIQQKIVAEIGSLESKCRAMDEQGSVLRNAINVIVDTCFQQKEKFTRIKEISEYSKKRIDVKALTAVNYVGVDNLLQNMEGKTDSQFLPKSGSATAYVENDILLSNIRPYLKKIWFADNRGGSSNDVLVISITSPDVMPKFLYYMITTDDFFDYEMQNIKGVKMPRGKSEHIMNYQIPLLPLERQRQIVAEIEESEKKIELIKSKLADLEMLRNEILKKYL